MIKLSLEKNINQIKKDFFKKGYAIIKNAISKDDCEILKAEALKVKKKMRVKTFAPLMMPHRFSRKFLRIIKNPKILKNLKKIFGRKKNFYAIQTQYFFGKPGTIGFAKHQDNFYVESNKKNSFLSCWITLNDLNSKMGSLILYEKSHLQGILETKKKKKVKLTNQDRNANNEETILSKKFKKKRIIENAGSVVLIHGDLVHESEKNISNTNRDVLLATYIKENVKFRRGRTAKRYKIHMNS